MFHMCFESACLYVFGVALVPNPMISPCVIAYRQWQWQVMWCLQQIWHHWSEFLHVHAFQRAVCMLAHDKSSSRCTSGLALGGMCSGLVWRSHWHSAPYVRVFSMCGSHQPQSSYHPHPDLPNLPPIALSHYLCVSLSLSLYPYVLVLIHLPSISLPSLPSHCDILFTLQALVRSAVRALKCCAGELFKLATLCGLISTLVDMAPTKYNVCFGVLSCKLVDI